ncbi:RNA polymerase sigma factor [Chitinophaga sp. S165]|uniref:RNA polymerase sigma factor n=1 Tax=Chitinophaga sp. S165 TaxID=2135462 RepID=UPI000D715190|nr:sigma-70 family RNA polymerase sigma factor [Chitinophaga sp. S165]PWV56128.1 RNA polymerase sigma-70 factor (ECF subfamily) [Chitinophaga sp. S165]
MQQDTDTDLLQRMKKGDESAFRELYNRHSRQVAAFVFHLTHSAVDAEDILQETFLKLWTNRDQLPPIVNPGNYIFIIARNKTLDHLRKIAQQQKLVDHIWSNISNVADALDLQLDARESQQLINTALSRLTEQQRTIFRLSRQEGLDHAAIANQLQLSKSRVKNVQVETLRFLRQFLSRHSELLLLLFILTTP